MADLGKCVLTVTCVLPGPMGPHPKHMSGRWLNIQHRNAEWFSKPEDDAGGGVCYFTLLSALNSFTSWYFVFLLHELRHHGLSSMTSRGKLFLILALKVAGNADIDVFFFGAKSKLSSILK